MLFFSNCAQSKILINITLSTDIHMNYYNLIPMIFVALGSYAIASVFFSVYGMAVDTIFLCFLMDIDQHGM